MGRLYWRYLSIAFLCGVLGFGCVVLFFKPVTVKKVVGLFIFPFNRSSQCLQLKNRKNGQNSGVRDRRGRDLPSL